MILASNGTGYVHYQIRSQSCTDYSSQTGIIGGKGRSLNMKGGSAGKWSCQYEKKIECAVRKQYTRE